jgi:hypothetical protein
MGVRAAFSGRRQPEAGEVAIAGADPVFSTRFKIGETCAAVLGGVGVAISDIWELKTGRRQKVSIDVRYAAAPHSSATQRGRGRTAPSSVVSKNHEHDSDHAAMADQRWALVLTHFGLRTPGRMRCWAAAQSESVAKAVAGDA